MNTYRALFALQFRPSPDADIVHVKPGEVFQCDAPLAKPFLDADAAVPADFPTPVRVIAGEDDDDDADDMDGEEDGGEEAPAMTLEEARARAIELGVKFRRDTPLSTIMERIAAAEQDAAARDGESML